jgi:hypothetical protein
MRGCPPGRMRPGADRRMRLSELLPYPAGVTHTRADGCSAAPPSLILERDLDVLLLDALLGLGG